MIEGHKITQLACSGFISCSHGILIQFNLFLFGVLLNFADSRQQSSSWSVLYITDICKREFAERVHLSLDSRAIGRWDAAVSKLLEVVRSQLLHLC